MPRTHYHVTFGHHCRCPWGDNLEHLGSVKTAAKIDWLKERPDLQDDEAQDFLRKLEARYADADKVLPWFVREWRKKRLKIHPNTGHLQYVHPEDSTEESVEAHSHFPTYRDYQAARHFTQITPHHAKLIEDTLAEMKKHRQGIDIMQHKVHDLVPKVIDFQKKLEAKKRQGLGEVLHRFDDGWTVRRLQNRDECRDEGSNMGHCVGSYGDQVQRGESFIVSLRDANNWPHATMELNGYGKQCGACGAMNNAGRWTQCGECYEEGRLKPTPAHGMDVVQFYGKQDSPPKDEYRDRMNQWLDQYGVQANTFEPWWDEYYEVEGPERFDHFVGHYNGYGEHGLPDLANYPEEDWREWSEPEEYQTARYEAEEHGLDEPDLHYGNPDYYKIIESMVDPSDMGYYSFSHRGRQVPEPRYRPQWADYLVQQAERQGHSDLLGEALNEHVQTLQDDHGPWEEWHQNEDIDPIHLAYLNHIGQAINPNWQPLGANPPRQVNPQQGMLFVPGDPNTGTPHTYPEMMPPPTLDGPPQPAFLPHRNFAKVATSEVPLYYRFVFSPETGAVELGHNGENHPAKVRYHEDMAGKVNRPNLIHGYAYRLHGGWRMTDWEHRPLEDPFVVSQVIQALRGVDPMDVGKDEGPTWQPASYDFERTHYGQPVPAED